MIDLSDVSFAYPKGGFRLSVPDLVIAEGARVAVVGPSGTGKTTLLNLVAGLDVPERGAVRVGDTVVSDLSEAQRRAFRAQTIGFVFQNFALMDYLSARQNILYPYRIAPGLRLDAAAKARSAALAGVCCLIGCGRRAPSSPLARPAGRPGR